MRLDTAVFYLVVMTFAQCCGVEGGMVIPNVWREEVEVSKAEATQIEIRRDWVIRMMLEREPEHHMLEKVFGKELTARIVEAME